MAQRSSQSKDGEVLQFKASCALLGSCLAYLLCDFAELPRPIYEPFLREWSIGSQGPSSSSLLYPGMLLWALAGGAAGYVVGWQLVEKIPSLREPRVMSLVSAWGLGLVGFCALYFAWSLRPF